MRRATGRAQPYVNLFDNGGFLLNVSVNGVPLTQSSATRPHTPVFQRAGSKVISAANGSQSTDYYVRDGGVSAVVASGGRSRPGARPNQPLVRRRAHRVVEARGRVGAVPRPATIMSWKGCVGLQETSRGSSS